MIQRIQTIWLLLASSFALLSIKTSFFSGHRIKSMNSNLIQEVEYVKVTALYNPMLNIITIAMATVIFITIFLFKNRKLQIRFTIISLILSLLTLGLYFWQYQSFNVSESTFTITAIIPIAIPVLLILALRGIYKDHKLIKSLDRLR